MHIAALRRHYVTFGRLEAAINLRAAVLRGSKRIEDGPASYFDAPRPYPGLARPGRRWIKEGIYWIAYAVTDQGPVIVAVFHESADIPGRL